MPVINYDHAPNDEVYIISEDDDGRPTVIKSKIIEVKIRMLISSEILKYKVSNKVNNNAEVDAENVYALKADAIAAFDALID